MIEAEGVAGDVHGADPGAAALAAVRVGTEGGDDPVVVGAGIGEKSGGIDATTIVADTIVIMANAIVTMAGMQGVGTIEGGTIAVGTIAVGTRDATRTGPPRDPMRTAVAALSFTCGSRARISVRVLRTR
jgi:hypothetical protein